MSTMREIIRKEIDLAIARIPLAKAMTITDSGLRQWVRDRMVTHPNLKNDFEEELSLAAADFFRQITTPNLVKCQGGDLTHIPPQKGHIPLEVEKRTQDTFPLDEGP